MTEKDRRVLTEEGWVELKWPDPSREIEVELQQSAHEDFADPVVRYRGTDRGSVITGLPEGFHYFRVREVGPDDEPPDWSPPLTVEVVFMKRSTLFLFLGTGCVVVLLTVGTIIAGHFTSKSAK